VGQVPTQCPGSNKLVCGSPETECTKPCTPGYGGDGAIALDARMAQPFGQSADPAGRITFDLAGNLIFADTDNNRIRKVDAAGIITTLAGTGVAGYSGDDGPAAQAQVNRPVDVETAPDGTIYFSDAFNSCVRKIDTSGTISTVAGMCSSNPKDHGFDGDGGSPLEAKLDRPAGIEIVGKKLYICDSYNNRVRVVNLP
jgi:sugar lactone lactonase YvrE